jgi:hypothetical protein
MEIAEIIRRRYNKAQEIFDPITERIEINRNLYRGIINVDDNYDWDYSLVDPHVFPLVRNYLSRSNPTMSNIRLDPRKPQDYEKREVNQSFLNWEVGELMLTSLFYRMYFSGYLAGKGYLKDGWKHQKAVIIAIKDPKTGEITEQKIIRDIVNRADAQFVRFNDLLIPNRNNPNLDEQPYVIELTQKLVGDMLDENERLTTGGEKAFWNEKWLKDLKKAGVKSKLLDYQIDMVTDDDQVDPDDLAFRSAFVPLISMQTLNNDLFYLPLDKDSKDIVNNEKTNPYWHGHYPYVDFTPFPEDDEFYSAALVDVVGDLQIAATEILNQTLTNIRQINNDMWIAGTSAAQTPDWQFKRRPDGLIRVAGDASQVQNVRTQDNTMSALRMGEAVGNKIEKAGGISQLYASGVPNGGINQTARGAQIIDQNIDTNMRMIIDLFGEQVIKRLGEHFLELNSQYVTEEQTFFITGKKGVRDFIKLDPSMISANFDVSVNAERMVKQTPASRQASLQNTITILQDIQLKGAGSVIVDVTPVVDALMDATPDMENVDDVVVSIDEKGKRDMTMLERGQMPDVKVRDPHKELIMYANVWFQDHQAKYPQPIKDLFAQYLQQHMKYIQSEMQIKAMSQPVVPGAAPANALQDQMGQTKGMNEGNPGGGYNLKPL